MKRSSAMISPLSNARRAGRWPHRLIASFAGVALILLFAASASADLLEETTTSVGSLPGSVTEAAPTPPPPPPASPPATPPVHVSVPAPPTLDSSPPPVEPTSGGASASPGLAGGLASGASELAEGAGSIGSADLQTRPGQPPAAGPGGPGATGHTAQHPSVKPRQPALPRRLLAYVWPAIALGPFGRLLSALESRLRAAASLSLRGAPRLPSGLPEALGGRGSAPERSAASAPPQADSPSSVSLPGAAAISLLVLLLASAAMVALLVFAVRFEMGFVHHRRPHS